MKQPDYIPPDYTRIRVVDNLKDLLRFKLGRKNDVNCIVLPRHTPIMTIYFNALAKRLHEIERDDYARFDRRDLKKIAKYCSGTEQAGLEIIIKDMSDLSRFPFWPSRGYSSIDLAMSVDKGGGRPSDETFHTDSHMVSSKGRVLCTYAGSVTEWIRDEDAYQEANTNQFKAKPGALIHSFRQGDIYKFGTVMMQWPSCYHDPFIHRAPVRKKLPPPEGSVRLVLFADTL